MGLDSEPFPKPIGRANSTRGQPWFNLESLEILESPQTVENKGDADLFLEILEILFRYVRDFNLESLEILESLQTVENKGDADLFLEILEILFRYVRDSRLSRFLQ